MLANPYRAAIQASRDQAIEPAQSLADGLKAVDTAMQHNCWQSSVADRFYAELTQQRTVLSKCQTNALSEFDDAIRSQPVQVPQNSWQFHWHNLR